MNVNKNRCVFYTIFRNFPYTDDEWKRENEHRQKLADNPRINPRYKEKYHIHKTRPNHSFRHGPSAYSHEEARAICEKAIANGAQSVGYSVYYGSASCRADERWTLRKGRTWKESRRKYD